MSVISIGTPFNIDLEFKLASFGRRLGAAAIDVLVLFLYAVAYHLLIQRNIDNEVAVQIADTFLWALPAMLYHFLMELFMNGTSLGKRALGIRVVDMKGNEPSISQYLIRNLFRGLPLVIVFIVLFSELGSGAFGLFFLGLFGVSVATLLIYITNKKSQRVGDILAGTIVIDENGRGSIHDTIYLEIEENNYKAQHPEVMRLTDRDINGIRNLLDAKVTADNEIYMSQVAYRIKEVLGIQSNLETRSFLMQLLRDYNFLTRK